MLWTRIWLQNGCQSTNLSHRWTKKPRRATQFTIKFPIKHLTKIHSQAILSKNSRMLQVTWILAKPENSLSQSTSSNSKLRFLAGNDFEPTTSASTPPFYIHPPQRSAINWLITVTMGFFDSVTELLWTEAYAKEAPKEEEEKDEVSLLWCFLNSKSGGEKDTGGYGLKWWGFEWSASSIRVRGSIEANRSWM